MNEKKYFPFYGWIGILFVVCFWILNWTLSGLRTHWGFFPLWLGYCLIIESMVYYREGTGSSSSRAKPAPIWRGSRAKASAFRKAYQEGEKKDSLPQLPKVENLKSYILLFIISMPCWWLFEFFNFFTQNWFYDGREYFTDLEYFLLASLSFSTVIPAVFGTAKLVQTFKWSNKFSELKKFSPGKNTLLTSIVTGVTIIVLIIIYPNYFYPLIWVSMYLVIEPINAFLKNRTLLDCTSKGDWSFVFSLAAGALICGFFWEMWNFYSYPKWVYNLPGLNFAHIFEMPVLGWLGYIPFSFELFAIYNLLTGLIKRSNLHLFTFN